jgi:glycosyl transferase, family 25
VTIFPGFDRIRIINLPSRPDRRAEMVRELRRIGLDRDPRVQFVDGVLVEDKAPWRAPGEKGVFLAQLGIIEDAAATGESVLILEDDVDFTPAAQSWGRPADCDIAYGGYLPADPNDLQSTDIIGAHCIGFSARAVQALAPFLGDLLSHESPPPIDGAYVWFRRQREGFRTEFAEPVVAVQRPSRSDITPAHRLDKVAVLRGPMAGLRKLKRWLQRGDLTFGLREAIILSIVAVAITIAVARHFTSG